MLLLLIFERGLKDEVEAASLGGESEAVSFTVLSLSRGGHNTCTLRGDRLVGSKIISWEGER